MSLDYNLSKIRDYKELLAKDGPDKGCPDTMLKSVIFACMGIGMGEIKNEADALEFYARLSFYEKVRGAFRYTGGKGPAYFTLDEVKRCIGLSTNCFPKESGRSFAGRLFKNYASDVAYESRKKEAA